MSEILDESFNDEMKKNYPGKLAGVAYRLNLAEEKVNQSRYFLYFLIGLTVLNLFLLTLNTGWMLSAGHIIYLVLLMIFITASYVSTKKTSFGLILALMAYTIFHLILLILFKIPFFESIIGKLITYFFLFSGLFYSFQSNKLKKELEREMKIIQTNL